RIRGRDVDRRRHDLRVLRDRQRLHGHQSDDDDDDRENGGEDGPIDEEACEHRPPPYDAAFGGDAGGSGPRRMLTFCGVTVTPGRARWMPLTTTHSPGASPSVTSRSPSCSAPSFTGLYSTTFLSFTTSTYFRSWSVAIARSVTRRPGLGSPTGRRTRTNRP